MLIVWFIGHASGVVKRPVRLVVSLCLRFATPHPGKKKTPKLQIFIYNGCLQSYSRLLVWQSLFVWLVGFLTSLSATRLSRRQIPRPILCAAIQGQSGKAMATVSACHMIILTQTQPVGIRHPGQGVNLPPPDLELHILPTDLPLWQSSNSEGKESYL